MREWLTPDAAATEHGNELSRAQVSQIFKWYMEDMKKNLSAKQQGSEMEILLELRRSQNETRGRARLRCKRYLDDRASSSAAFRYRATTSRATLRSRPRGCPRKLPECVGVAGSYRHCALAAPHNERVSRCCSKIRSRARPIRSRCCRATDKGSHSQSKV